MAYQNFFTLCKDADPGIPILKQAKAESGVGGPGRDRTDDLFHAMEARSQLRHRPTCEREISSGIPQWNSGVEP